jgi:hypothetical protein
MLAARNSVIVRYDIGDMERREVKILAIIC